MQHSTSSSEPLNSGRAAVPARAAARTAAYGAIERAVAARVGGRVAGGGAGADLNVAAWLCDVLWEALAPTGVSWIGFYVGPGVSAGEGGVAGPEQMLLGPRRDKPACSPIGLHGVCGRGWRERRSIVVRDVAVLGADYVACDPRDKSEVVVPLFDDAGGCWGVLDADSFDVGSFDASDAERLERVLVACGLSSGRGHAAGVLVV